MQISSSQQNIVDRLLGWWYAIAAPPQVSEDAPLQERTFIRKSRFTSIILLIELVYHIIYLFMVISIPSAVIPITATIIFFVIGVILNRNGKQRAANIIAFVAIELSMCLYFISQIFGGLGLSISILGLFSMLVSPDVIAISLFPALVSLPLSILNCLFVVFIMAFAPKAPEMVQLLTTTGPLTYFQVVSVQAVVILVSLFWVRNTNGEMGRANQAEEMNKLMQELATQQQVALEEKQQIEESIQQIVTVHTQVANGNLNARVPLDKTNILWSIAGSLNNLLARLQSWRQEVQQAQYVEKSIQQALRDIRQAKALGTPLNYQKTGTAIDLLVAEFTGNNHSSHPQQDKMTPIPGLPFQEHQRSGQHFQERQR